MSLELHRLVFGLVGSGHCFSSCVFVSVSGHTAATIAARLMLLSHWNRRRRLASVGGARACCKRERGAAAARPSSSGSSSQGTKKVIRTNTVAARLTLRELWTQHGWNASDHWPPLDVAGLNPAKPSSRARPYSVGRRRQPYVRKKEAEYT